MVNDPEQISIKAQWALDATSVPPVVNQILIQHTMPDRTGRPDGAYVTFGHLNPPVMPDGSNVTDGPETGNLVFPVMPVARFHVSMERLAEFRDHISGFLDDIESALEGRATGQ
jgi:hypothetical protein